MGDAIRLSDHLAFHFQAISWPRVSAIEFPRLRSRHKCFRINSPERLRPIQGLPGRIRPMKRLIAIALLISGYICIPAAARAQTQAARIIVAGKQTSTDPAPIFDGTRVLAGVDILKSLGLTYSLPGGNSGKVSFVTPDGQTQELRNRRTRRKAHGANGSGRRRRRRGCRVGRIQQHPHPQGPAAIRGVCRWSAQDQRFTSGQRDRAHLERQTDIRCGSHHPRLRGQGDFHRRPGCLARQTRPVGPRHRPRGPGPHQACGLQGDEHAALFRGRYRGRRKSARQPPAPSRIRPSIPPSRKPAR